MAEINADQWKVDKEDREEPKDEQRTTTEEPREEPRYEEPDEDSINLYDMVFEGMDYGIAMHHNLPPQAFSQIMHGQGRGQNGQEPVQRKLAKKVLQSTNILGNGLSPSKAREMSFWKKLGLVSVALSIDGLFTYINARAQVEAQKQQQTPQPAQPSPEEPE